MIQFLLHLVRRPLIKGFDFFVDISSLLLFGLIDVLDQLLCYAFAFLDSIWDQKCASCYCHRKAGSQVTEASEGYGRGSPPDDECFKDKGPLPGLFFKEASQAGIKNGVDLRYLDAASETLFGTRHGQERLPGHLHVLHRWRVSLHPFSSWLLKLQKLGTSMYAFCTTGGGVTQPCATREASSCWSDCSCNLCTSWISGDQYLHVHVEGYDGTRIDDSSFPQNNVVFSHGFLSSSSFWTDTVLPYLSSSLRPSYRLFAVDLLGFGKSPKPRNCAYTISDHIAMIKSSLLHKYGVERFHIVAHSMGCVIALALAAQDPGAVQSITLISPPFFPASRGAGACDAFLREIAPRKVWPPLTLGTSIMSWYEHVGRLVCMVICKNHRLWDPFLLFLLPRILGHRLPPSFIRDFTQHTHHSAWHVFHNTLCGGARIVEGCVRSLGEAGHDVWVMYGADDNICPPKSSLSLARRCPNVRLKRIPGANHITCVVGREEALARDLKHIITQAEENEL